MKYKHKHTGQIVTKGTDGLYHSKQGGYTLQRWIFENSNDWEEVKEAPKMSSKEHTSKVKQVSGEYIKEEPNYLITAFRDLRSSTFGHIWKIMENGKYSCNGFAETTKEHIINTGNCVNNGSFEIYSVKNFSGIEFTLNDTVFYQSEGKRGENFKIHNFFINRDGVLLVRSSNESYATCEDINTIIKCKSPIYTTTDGVDIFEGDRLTLFIALKDLHIPTYEKASKVDIYNGFSELDAETADRYLTFTSAENRDRYIKENQRKPIFTSADGKEIFQGDAIYHFYKPFEYTMHKSIVRRNTIYGDVIFYTEEKAKEYIDNNKPKYSLNDIEKAYRNTLSPIESPLFQSFKSNLINLGK